jgi:hypothetical protein
MQVAVLPQEFRVRGVQRLVAVERGIREQRAEQPQARSRTVGEADGRRVIDADDR